MPTFRITNRAANHRRKINGEWKRFGFGDQLELTEEQYRSGTYSHLRLEPVFGTKTKEAEESVDTKTEDNTGGEGNANTGGEDNAEDNADNGDGEITEAQVKDLIARVEESRVDEGSFDKVRAEIEALDLFDNLPETKRGVLEALNGLLD